MTRGQGLIARLSRGPAFAGMTNGSPGMTNDFPSMTAGHDRIPNAEYPLYFKVGPGFRLWPSRAISPQATVTE